MTAPDTPYSHHPPRFNISDVLAAAVRQQMERRNQIIEAACVQALMTGIGVRVKIYLDGRTTAQPDPTVPAMTIYEEHPDQPTYGMTFED